MSTRSRIGRTRLSSRIVDPFSHGLGQRRPPKLPFCAVFVSLTALLGSTAQAAQTITINSTGTGGKYEGVGAVSGGGTFVLRHDYVEPQRSQIPDYLFKPKFGARNTGTLSRDRAARATRRRGSEPSHEHTSTIETSIGATSGGLWNKRACAIRAFSLIVTAWSAPAWVGGGNFFSKGTTTYLADFIAGANSADGLDLNYVGFSSAAFMNSDAEPRG